MKNFPSKLLCLCLCALFLLFPLVSCAAPEGDTESEYSPALREGAMRLAEHQKSDYRVVISATASEDVKKAAEEFVSYFHAITGVALEIVRDDTAEEACEIVVGRTARAIDKEVDYDKLGQEGYVYRTQGKSLLLSGNTDRAVAYAVYGFLEDRLDVRFWSADYETVPQRDVLDIAEKISVTKTPVFWYRDMSEIGGDDPEWMVKMRLNSRQSLGSERFRKNPSIGGGHGYADWFVHTIGKLAELPYNSGGNHNNVQPCLTDEDVYQTVLKNVRRWLDEYPDATIVSVSQNDGTKEEAMCSCDNCKKIYEQHGNVQSALWIWFVSRVANELADEYPDVYFETLSYNFTTIPPTGLDIPDNVIVRCASAFCCLNHGYAECAVHNGTTAQKKSATFSSTLSEWGDLCENIFVWDYSTLFSNFWSPFPNFDTLRTNYQFFAENGVKGIFSQGGEENAPFGELRAYLTAKLLWDPFLSEEEYDALICEFLEGYYGEGTSAPLCEYFSLFNEKIKDDHFHLYAGVCADFAKPDVYEDEEGVHLDYAALIDPMKACFEEAKSHVTDETQKQHLRKAEIELKTYEVSALFTLARTYENAVFDLDERTRLSRELCEDVHACGMTSYSEGGRIPLPEDADFSRSPGYWGQKD